MGTKIYTYISIYQILCGSKLAKFFFLPKDLQASVRSFDVFTHPLIHSDMAPGSSRQEELQRLSTKVQEALEEALGG